MEIFLDSIRGIYIYRDFYLSLSDFYKNQMGLSDEEKQIIQNPDHEEYVDLAWDIINMTYFSEKEEIITFEENEEGIWLIIQNKENDATY
jgi:hypothetical protein